MAVFAGVGETLRLASVSDWLLTWCGRLESAQSAREAPFGALFHSMCPNCRGSLCADWLGLADAVCLLCSRRFNADLSPIQRVASQEERIMTGRLNRSETAQYKRAMAVLRG